MSTVFVELENVVSDCSKNTSASVRVCLMLVCVFAHSRVGTTGWWRCSSYIISISLPHSDREEGGSCRLPSHHLQPTEASPLLVSFLILFLHCTCFISPLVLLSSLFSPSFPAVHPSVTNNQPVIVKDIKLNTSLLLYTVFMLRQKDPTRQSTSLFHTDRKVTLTLKCHLS